MNEHDIKSEISEGIKISSFLGTVALFFAGILVSRFEVFNESIKVPILFLIVATFGFIFSAIVYANMTGTIRTEKKQKDQYLRTGNVISEYLGLYPFIISIPMVVSAISADKFLRYSILIVTLVSIFIYTVSQYSLVRRKFGSKSVWALALFVSLIVIVSSLTQNTNTVVFNITGLVFLVVMTLLAVIQSHQI